MDATQRTAAPKNTAPAKTFKAPGNKKKRMAAKEIETQAEKLQGHFWDLLSKNADKQTQELLSGYTLSLMLMAIAIYAPLKFADEKSYKDTMGTLKKVTKILERYEEKTQEKPAI